MRILLLALSYVCVSAIAFAKNPAKNFNGFVKVSSGVELYVDYTAPKKGKPTVVFVNGLTQTVRDNLFVAGFLTAQGYGVLLYDANGMGQTLLHNPLPKSPIGYEAQIEDLDQLLDIMNIPAPYNMTGLSYGGGILTGYGVRHPEKVRKLMLMAPYTETIESSKKIILGQIAATRLFFPDYKGSDEELANFYIRQFVYQTYPFYEPTVLENPFKLEGVVALVQGITPYRPIDEVAGLPENTVHLIIGDSDQYVTKNVYDSFWLKLPKNVKESYAVVSFSEHKIPTVYPYFVARWIHSVVNDAEFLTGGKTWTANPALMSFGNSNGDQETLLDF